MNKSCYLLFAIALLLLSRRDAAAFDYADALDKAILFFEAQRSGKLLVGQRVAWRANSGLSDGSADHVDLVGGYYDAGDNVKFGFPMAFTVTMLAWGVIEFGDTMPRGQLNNANAAVRWGADYLVRAATAKPDTLYVQVAEPNQDHRCWERPEDMDTPRNVYKVTPQNPGSDVAGETSAALAASSLVFRNSDRAYAGKLLQTAQKVFKFADQHRGAYSDSLGSVVCPFYCSYSGYRDELLWAASWLHVASRGSTGEYLSYINDNGGAFGGADDSFTFSWDDKRPATKLLLSKVFLEGKNNALKQYKEGADRYICSLVPEAPGFQSQYTPGGLLYKEGASNMQYVTATTFLLVTYAKYLNANSASSSCGVTTSTIISLAKKQVDYILGANPAGMSYMVGFGLRYPRHVHHRGASEPSVHVHPGHISCEEGFQYLHTNTPDTNVIVGALVGGPDNSDKFTDSRDNYQQTEPTTYTNAPLVGALAFFAGQAQVKQRLHS